MNEFLRQRATLTAIGLIMAFLILATVTPPEHLKRWMDAGRFGFAMTVAIVCARPAVEVFHHGAKDRGDQVIVAVFLVWALITAQAIWIPISREVALPVWFPETQVSAVFPYLFMVSAAFFLVPIGNGSKDLPTGNWPLIAVAGAIGAGAMGFMLGAGFAG